MGMDLAHAWSETDAVWGGCFVELQVGVAPTQSHVFKLPARSSHQHSEWFQLLDGLKAPEKLYADDYATAVDAVADFVNSPAGVPPDAWASTE